MPEIVNNRYLDITDDIRIGYNYILSKFYVTNKETTTYRATVEEIQEILHALSIYDVQDGVIASFKASTENLTELYFTWSDTGAYIRTIQLNDYKDYALNLDCEKAKLYIMNSTIVFDLNTQESPKIVRVPKICSFYKYFLGLEVSQEDMLVIYNFLVSYFAPTCYRQIQPRETMEEPLYYNNNILLSNYSGEAKTVYNLKINPRNKYIPIDIADIEGINSTTNTITLINPIPESIINKYSIAENSSIIIQGTETTINEGEYSADGTYLIDRIEGNTIKVTGTIPIDYSFIYPSCYVEADTLTITSMSRAENTITVQEEPTNIIVGDTIIVKGATVITEYEEISCDNQYTVTGIDGKVLSVQEAIPTDFEGNATLTKQVFLGYIKSIQNNVVTFKEHVEITLQDATIIVYNNNVSTSYRVIAQDKENNMVVVESIDDYTPKYPKLQYPSPSTEIMVDITYVDPSKEELLPTGEFLLDTPEQAQAYLSNYPWVVIPESIPSMVNLNKVISKIILNFKEERRIVNLLGLYSEIYAETEK